MSGAERTGATEAQIEAAAKRYHVWDSSDPDTYRPWEKVSRRTQECLKEIAEEMLSAAVPPGSRIIDAEDAAAIRRVAAFARATIRFYHFKGSTQAEEMQLHQDFIDTKKAITADDVARLARLGQG